MRKTSVKRGDARGELSFNKDYQKQAHMQHSTNERYLKQLIGQFQLKFPNKDAEIHCLDIGCGGGKTTLAFYQKLKDLGYSNIYLTGLDISNDQIAAARNNLTEYSKQKDFESANVTFRVGDALELKDKKTYDMVFSFFTFHWIDDKLELSKNIADSLKPEGLLFYLTVTTMARWFNIRRELLQELIKETEWAPYFEGFDITPFAQFSESEISFNKYFFALSSEVHLENLTFNDEKLCSFLSSWLPEIRHLRNVIKDEDEQQGRIDDYLDRLLSKIPRTPTKEKEVYTRNKGEVSFAQLYGTYFGLKKSSSEDSGDETRELLDPHHFH